MKTNTETKNISKNRIDPLDFHREGEEVSKSKKDRILELWKSGQHDIWLMAEDLSTRPSYVASVLQTCRIDQWIL